MKKKIVAGLLTAAMACVLIAGCAGQKEAKKEGEKKDKTFKVGFVVGSFEHVFYQQIRDGIEAQAKELGMDATVTDAELDPNIASDRIQDFVTQGCDAVALSCNDAAGVKPAIENADKEGVKMFTFDCTTDSDAIQCFVGTDNLEGGRLGGQELLKYSKDGDTVGIICYPTASSCLDRQNGALEVLEKENRKVIYDNNYEGDANKAQEIMENMLTAHPDMTAVFCVGDPAATGALAAIKAAGSDCKIIGFDGNPEAKEAISDKEGNGKWWVSEIAQNPKEIGKQIVEQMHQYLSTGKVKEKTIYIAPYVIDASNVSEK